MNNPLLITFIGVPGSGKTTFARQLASRIGATYFNSHTVRLAIVGSIDELSELMEDPRSRKINDRATFRLMDYMTEQVLQAGGSVVYDANANKRKDRIAMKELAQKYGGEMIVVWVRTPHDVATIRASEREGDSNSKKFSPDKATQIVEAFSRSIQEPGPDENVIEISGEIPFEQQYEQFQRGMKHA